MTEFEINFQAAVEDYLVAFHGLGVPPEHPASVKLRLRIAAEVHAAEIGKAVRKGLPGPARKHRWTRGTFPSAPPACPVIWLRAGRGLKEELFPFGVVVSLGALDYTEGAGSGVPP